MASVNATTWKVAACAGALASALLGCGSNSGGTGGSGGSGTGTATTSSSSTSTGGGDAQTPPMGGAAVEAWLAQGDYKKWTCEPAVHAARMPSPHGFNRICSNQVISSNATGTGTWPSGAAAVKELYASATDTTPDGYAVYLKTAADSAGGAAWYYYERIPPNTVLADGMGTSGPPLTICVMCHSLAGSDSTHTTSPGSRDFVYTPVP